MNDKIKKIAATISGIALALAMGIQTFVFGKSDMQKMNDDITAIAARVSTIESRENR